MRQDTTLLPEPSMVVRSKQMQVVVQQLRKVARVEFFPVLITGETGVGKQEAADFLHRTSNAIRRRAFSPFVDINCSGLATTLLESELFGHELGAFTGAVKDRVGLLENARDGSVFLDEIGDAGLRLQRRLLKYLDTGQITRVGGNEKRDVMTRVIAATNKDLRKAIARGRFKEDLFYRINVFSVHIPALRDRLDDIEPLVLNCIRRFNTDRNTSITENVSDSVTEMLKKHPWPGNIRELFNAVERAIVNRGGEGELCVDDFMLDSIEQYQRALPKEVENGKVSIEPEAQILEENRTLLEVEKEAAMQAGRRYILSTLEAHHWNRSRAAEKLGVSYKTFLCKIKDYGVLGEPNTPDEDT